MEQNVDLTQNVDTLFSNLESFTQNEGLIGKPVTHGDKTFIPVVSVTIGYGSGNTATKAQQGSSPSATGIGAMSGNGHMAGGALGVGAKLSTDAVIMIDKDNVSMMPLNATANVGQLMDKIPQMLSGLGGKQGQQNQQQGQQGQQQGQQMGKA